MQSGMRTIFVVCCLFFPFSNCTKSNYLNVGSSATVQADDGMNIRSEPLKDAKILAVASKGKAVLVVSEGKLEEFYGIKSRWYKVQYGRITGWMWGGLAKPETTNKSNGENNSSARDKLSKLTQNQEPFLAWEDNRQYCYEAYSSGFATKAEMQIVVEQIERQALASGKLKILKACELDRAREVFLFGPDGEPPPRNSEIARIMEKLYVAAYDYDQTRRISNEEYASILGTRGGVEKIK
jgi:hypothetical protein